MGPDRCVRTLWQKIAKDEQPQTLESLVHDPQNSEEVRPVRIANLVRPAMEG